MKKILAPYTEELLQNGKQILENGSCDDPYLSCLKCPLSSYNNGRSAECGDLFPTKIEQLKAIRKWYKKRPGQETKEMLMEKGEKMDFTGKTGDTIVCSKCGCKMVAGDVEKYTSHCNCGMKINCNIEVPEKPVIEKAIDLWNKYLIEITNKGVTGRLAYDALVMLILDIRDKEKQIDTMRQEYSELEASRNAELSRIQAILAAAGL